MAHDVLTAIDKLLHDKAARETVETFRKQLAEWNGPENVASLLKEHYGLFGNDSEQIRIDHGLLSRSILVRQ
ncbi:MAG: hypothetical protein ABFS39_14855 [Pseudomonadota bacterium]